MFPSRRPQLLFVPADVSNVSIRHVFRLQLKAFRRVDAFGGLEPFPDAEDLPRTSETAQTVSTALLPVGIGETHGFDSRLPEHHRQPFACDAGTIGGSPAPNLAVVRRERLADT